MNLKLKGMHRIGAIAWMFSIQYYVVQLVVARSWQIGDTYSWANNTISDLGNTSCSIYGSRMVCSSLHPLMNGSFILLGVTMITGALFIGSCFSSNLPTKLGFACMGLAGLGSILVGLFPENTISSFHIIGAGLSFVLGNLGVLAIVIYLKKIPTSLRVVSIIFGLIGLAALVLFVSQSYLSLGIGGMERFVAYPQSLWMILFGAYILRNDKKVFKD